MNTSEEILKENTEFKINLVKKYYEKAEYFSKIIFSRESTYEQHQERIKARDYAIAYAEAVRDKILQEFIFNPTIEDYNLLLENREALRIEFRRYCPVNYREKQFGLYEDEEGTLMFGDYALAQDGNFLAWANGINLRPYCYQYGVNYKY